MNRNPNPDRYACTCGSTRLFRCGTYEVGCRDCTASFPAWPRKGAFDFTTNGDI